MRYLIERARRERERAIERAEMGDYCECDNPSGLDHARIAKALGADAPTCLRCGLLVKIAETEPPQWMTQTRSPPRLFPIATGTT